MSKALLFCVLILIVAISAQPTEPADENVEIISEGASFPYPLYNEWHFGYQLLKPAVKIQYTPSGSGAGRRAIYADTVEFAGSDSPMSSSDRAKYPDIRQFPFLAGANVLVYNIPELPIAQWNLGHRVVLSRSSFVGIFNSSITQWNDPRILADQTSTVVRDVLSNLTAWIKPIIRSDGSGTTTITLQTMANIEPNFLKSPNALNGTIGDRFPASLRNNVNFTQGPQNFGVYAQTLLIPYSIGYVSYGFIIGEPVTYALLINKAGHVVGPTASEVQSALAAAQYNQYNVADISDQVGEDSYPIIGASYILINTSQSFAESGRCVRRRELFKYFNWLLTESWPNERAARSGYATQAEAKRQEMLGQLQLLTCIDPSLSAPISLAGAVVIPQHEGGGYIAVFAIAMVAFAATELVILVFMIREWEIMPKPALAFAFLLIVGSSLAHVSNIMWFLVPSSTAVCELRKWFVIALDFAPKLCPTVADAPDETKRFVCLGFCIMLGALFAKTFQINEIYRFAKASARNQSLTRGVRHMFIITATMLVIILVQIILLVLWSSLDPWTAERVLNNSLEITEEWRCVSPNGQFVGWIIAEIVYFLLLCGFGLYVVYRTWDMKYSVFESKWILISIYNVILVMAVLIPLLSILSASDDTLFYFATVAVAFLTFTTIFAVYIPKFARRPFGMSQTTSSATTGGRRLTARSRMAGVTATTMTRNDAITVSSKVSSKVTSKTSSKDSDTGEQD